MLPILFEGVSKRFDQTLAVNNLSLEIKAGEMFFLLGPSGCGKTTCLRMVAGFYSPDGGQLKFGERVMNNVPPHKRNTGMVFQNYALWPHLTCAQNVEYGLNVRKVPRDQKRKRVLEALEMVKLEKLGERYPNQLSGGQQQRVALARALVIRPDVLLLDEPLSNLDAQLRLEMRREIKRLHEQSETTAVYVTHDQDEALSVADRIAVMKDGLLQQVGSPRELYRLPQSRFVAEFIGETNFLPGEIESISSDSVAIQTPVGLVHAARQSNDSWKEKQNVWCSIRPEAWHIERDKAVLSTHKSETARENRFEAQLQSAMYGGETEQYQLVLSGGRENNGNEAWRHVKASLLNPEAQTPQTGTTLTLKCSPDDVVVLAE